MNNKKKIVLLVVAFVLTIAASVGVTLAWLTAKPGDVTNTFAPSTIKIELTETKGTEISNGREFLMVPGHTIDKDPTVTVKAGSQKCYVFVKVDESANLGDYISFAIDGNPASDGETWHVDNPVENVMYRVCDSADVDQSFPILSGNKVTVNQDVTESDMELLETFEENCPKLTFTAYAVQFYETNGHQFTPAEAWAKVSGS